MAVLRVVLDQANDIVDPDQADAARSLVLGLAETAPPRCEVEAIVPSGGEGIVPGARTVHRLALARRELGAAWQLGVVAGVGGGMIHAPSLFAPLVKHDRVNDYDQTVVTVWDLRAWTAPEELPRASVLWQRGMLKRAVKHADAVVVPTHAMAERLADLGRFADRIRVIPGAVADGFGIPLDATERRAALGAPARYLVATGGAGTLEPVFGAAVAVDADVFVLDAPAGAAAAIAETAASAGLPAPRVHIPARLDAPDRAALLAGALAFTAADVAATWPWRMIEALTLGVPVVAADGGVHRDVLAEGGVLVGAEGFAEAVRDAAGDGARRLSVMAADRSRAYSWNGSAERVWTLHAEL
ncbi:Glycosyltransferase involved in cell wall bisynthesis [Microbacterium sp. 8M]|uniref:glycosyltransferase n=1 Tax=Microbacterium sp. 8M TaxID=2653153 RepID=UPI0012EF0DD3|nr:glycosyltransferase [Microbacterium sp. 8M]VXB13543.1 Glycosyltransferase involved in cell wall bisynthesis [Microbacterium sp. 8M]